MNTINVWFQRVIRSKTIQTANIIAILGILQTNSDFLSTVLTPNQFGWVMIGISVVMVVLRAKTDSSLADK